MIDVVAGLRIMVWLLPLALGTTAVQALGGAAGTTRPECAPGGAAVPETAPPGPANGGTQGPCLGWIQPGVGYFGTNNGLLGEWAARCALAWIYADASRLYASTAGHCVSVGEAVQVAGIGAIGRVAFSTGDGGLGNDFALISIDEALWGRVRVHICLLGGPTKGFEGDSILGQPILRAGVGPGIGGPPRTLLDVGFTWRETYFSWIGGALNGDSGSPVSLAVDPLHAGGEALGVLTHATGAAGFSTPTVGWGTRWDQGIALAAGAGITNLRLVTDSDGPLENLLSG